MKLARCMVIVGALGTSVALAGGSIAGASSSGTSTGSPSQILTKAIKAQQGASSFRVTGLVHTNDETLGLDATASNAGKGFGSVSINGQSIQIIRVGGNVYFRAGAPFWKKQGGTTAARLFANKWVEGSTSNSDFSELAAFFTTQGLTGQFLTNTNSTSLVKAGTSLINGRPVIVLKGRDKGDGSSGKIFIASTGQPYVVRVTLTKGSTTTGSVTFSRFNAAVRPVPPKNALNLKSLGNSGVGNSGNSGLSGNSGAST